jgi:hypothetical protein
MADKKSNLAKLAKSNDKKKDNVNKKLTEVKKTEVKPLTPEEERDLKAKQRVEELLQDVSLKLTKDEKPEELLEVDDGEKVKNIEWFEEQIEALSAENALLKRDAEEAKENYAKILATLKQTKETGAVMLTNDNVDTELKAKVVRLFNEIQANHLSMGKNFIIVPVAFLNRLIMFFPFLQDERRF